MNRFWITVWLWTDFEYQFGYEPVLKPVRFRIGFKTSLVQNRFKNEIDFKLILKNESGFESIFKWSPNLNLVIENSPILQPVGYITGFKKYDCESVFEKQGG